jgi:hypothetical protein
VAELPGSLQGKNDGLRLFAVDCVMVLDLLLWMAACWMVVSLCSGLLVGCVVPGGGFWLCTLLVSSTATLLGAVSCNMPWCMFHVLCALVHGL